MVSRLEKHYRNASPFTISAVVMFLFLSHKLSTIKTLDADETWLPCDFKSILLADKLCLKLEPTVNVYIQINKIIVGPNNIMNSQS